MIDENNITPESLFTELKKTVIGQEQYLKDLCTAAWLHHLRYQHFPLFLFSINMGLDAPPQMPLHCTMDTERHEGDGTMGVYKETVTETKIDQDGTETSNTVEKTKMYDRASEPDYIKLYIKPWTAAKPDGTSACSIPAAYRGLFIQLAMRMNYCNSDDIKSAQIVNAGKPFSDDIMKALNWKISMYYKGLSGLVSCGAITRISGGLYRINPIYAARGEWRHNARLNRGGVKELIDELTNAREQEQYKKTERIRLMRRNFILISWM